MGKPTGRKQLQADKAKAKQTLEDTDMEDEVERARDKPARSRSPGSTPQHVPRQRITDDGGGHAAAEYAAEGSSSSSTVLLKLEAMEGQLQQFSSTVRELKQFMQELVRSTVKESLDPPLAQLDGFKKQTKQEVKGLKDGLEAATAKATAASELAEKLYSKLLAEQKTLEKKISDLEKLVISQGKELEAFAAATAESYAAAEPAGTEGGAGGEASGGERMASHAGRPMPNSTSSTVGAALQQEASRFGRMVKLQGIVDHSALQRASELELCAAASDALTRMVGGPVAIRAVGARWLRPPQQQQTPRLLVELESTAMARAVMQLKGRPGGRAGKLQAGQRVMCEFGPVEMAVREVLYKAIHEGGQGNMWVARSCIMARPQPGAPARPQALTAAAIAAGLQAMHKPARRQQA
jgi:hypothetical protein